jgi:hypothetical protein
MINPWPQNADWRNDEQDTLTLWVKTVLHRRFSLPQEAPDELLLLIDNVACRD